MNLEHVARIVREQELDALLATTVDGRNKLDYFTGTPDECALYVSMMNDALPGPFLLEGTKVEAATTRGRKSTVQTPFRWIMKGQQERPQERMAQPAPATVTVPDADAIRRAADADARAQVAEYTAEQLRLQVEELQALVDELSEPEPEDQDEPQAMAGPAWYQDGEQVVAVADRLVGMFGKLLKKPAPAVQPAQDISEDERKLLEAARRFKATAPDQAEQVFGQLLENFGTNEEPEQ